MKRIEEKAAQTILQKSITVTIGDKSYDVPPPSVATLILASEEIAKMPHFDIPKETENVLSTTMSIAKDCRFIGDIIAVLILGAKRVLKDDRKRFLWCKKNEEKQRIANEILLNYTPKQLNELFIRLLSRMEIADFFGLTVSLQGINILKSEETDKKTTTTPSGQ
ncbi:MAG: hypothetical protein LBQ31_09240 [Bacteroidales bacterium]|jgi:hypothetical protein|nr:hypothetical protein [Bacteroidales bacterium]